MEITDIYRRIAEEHNTTPEEVRKEMQEAILAGFHSTEPEIQKKWDSIPFQGEEPTPEEVITYLAAYIKSQLN